MANLARKPWEMFFSKGSVVQILLRYMASALKYMANGKPWELFLQFCLSNSAAMLSSSFHEVNFQKMHSGKHRLVIALSLHVLGLYKSQQSPLYRSLQYKSPLYKSQQVSRLNIASLRFARKYQSAHFGYFPTT